MTRISGNRFRPLFEEDDAARYKREGWDPRKTYEENMSGESLFVDDGSLEEPDLEPAPRRRPLRQVRDLAAQGRGEDTEVAHVARGELVVPRALQTPEFMAALARAAAAYGVPLARLSVGNAMNRINPNTGAPEFWFGLEDEPGRGWDSLTPKPDYELLTATSQIPAIGANQGSRQVDLSDIQVPAPYQPPSDPSMGTMRIPADASPSYKIPTDPGTGAMRLPMEPYSEPQAAHWPTQHGDIIKGPYGLRQEFNDFHRGMDFRNRLNDPVYTVSDGRIEHIGTNPNDRGGTSIIVRDKSNNLYGYAHSGAADGLKVGTVVKAGDQIGFSNGSGRTPKGKPIDPHLHMTFRPSTPNFSATMRTNYSNPNNMFLRLRDTTKR
jgi:murein DD-endopeptidase MepM/ murein hydrolase activator NlpD